MGNVTYTFCPHTVFCEILKISLTTEASETGETLAPDVPVRRSSSCTNIVSLLGDQGSGCHAQMTVVMENVELTVMCVCGGMGEGGGREKGEEIRRKRKRRGKKKKIENK